MPTDLGVKSPGQEMAAAVLAGHIDAWALEDNPFAGSQGQTEPRKLHWELQWHRKKGRQHGSPAHSEVREAAHSLRSYSTAAGGKQPSGYWHKLWARLTTPPSWEQEAGWVPCLADNEVVLLGAE